MHVLNEIPSSNGSKLQPNRQTKTTDNISHPRTRMVNTLHFRCEYGNTSHSCFTHRVQREVKTQFTEAGDAKFGLHAEDSVQDVLR